MLINLPEIENDIIKIREKCTEDNTGKEWSSLAKYIAVSILNNRIDQEINGAPAVSEMQLQLDNLEK
jgi:hypothetical protein